VNNEHEWISILDKLYKSGYRWYSHNDSGATSFDEWYRHMAFRPRALNLMKNERYPIVILAGDDSKNDKDLHYCGMDYIKRYYPNEYIKMMRRAKIKKIQYENR
jgi:hypothetical protein